MAYQYDRPPATPPEVMKATCQAMANSFEVGFEGWDDPHERDVDLVENVPSIHANGVTLQVKIGGETYVAEFRHVDDEAV